MFHEVESASCARLREFLEIPSGLFEERAGPPETLPKRSIIRSQGDPVEASYLLQSGWVISSIEVPTGARQIVKVHLPGDLLGGPSMVLTRAAETLTAATEVVVRRISLEDFAGIFQESPSLSALMFMASQQERVYLMDRIVSLGRTPAVSRLAAFLLHIYSRLKSGAQPSPRLEIPLTQDHLADILGLTPVHINRTYRKIERQGAILRSGRSITILDVAALREIAAVPDRHWLREPAWLKAALEPSPVQSARMVG